MTTRICSIPGCGYPANAARGWCRTHYKRWNETGDVKAHIPVRRTMPPKDRVDDFEFLLDAGETIPTAVARMGCHPKTILRAYQRLDRPIPDGLWAYERKHSREAAA